VKILSKILHHRKRDGIDQPSLASPQPEEALQPEGNVEKQPAPATMPAAIKERKPHKRLVKHLDTFIIKQFLGTFFFIIILVMAIVIMFDINEKLDAMLTAPLKETVFKYFMNFLPYIAAQFAPLFVFIAVIFFTSRLADRSEITAILSAGVSFGRLTVPYLVSAAVITAGMLYLSLYVIPPANVKRIEYTNQWVKNKRVDYGDNIQLQVRRGVMMHMARYDNITKHGSRISVEEFKGNALKSRLTASDATYDTLGRWKLTDYEMRHFDGLNETMRRGNNLDTTLNIDPKDFLIAKNDQEMLTSPELKKYIDSQKKRGAANIQQFEIEYERRYAMSAAAFILTIIGLSLSSRKVRGGIGLNIGIGLALSFSYILFMQVTQTFAVSGYTSPRVAMWIPNIIYSIIAIVLYKRASR
jgi:lipopolysaccharide export system permease protein